MKGRLKLSLIANNYLRKQTFKKRKAGIVKKLHEFTTLCGVKACAVICSPYENPVVWPSAEGVQEVVSKVMELPVENQCKYMFNHESYLRREINKAEKKVENLRSDNRETQLRQLMFDCLEGKMNQHPYAATDLQDLRSFIGGYIKKLDSRMNALTLENGESSSSTLLVPTSVAGADSPAVEVTGHPVTADASMVTAPNGFYGYFPDNGMTMNPNPSQHESLVKHHVPFGSVQHHVPVDSVQHHVPFGSVQHHVPFGPVQHGIYDMNLHQDMSLDPNQYLDQQGSFMNMLLGHPQQMGYDGENAQIPLMNDNYHQLPTMDFATTGHMPSINANTNTNTIAGVYAPNDINGLISEDVDF
ncbi:PREDICTED: agamous-like MADS-box protein AGL86 [Camelina sativa]|uniref:Agamous-like MADS-box protein AGL86 n=1 Tax=Camelina sativa TaxID=90675 RepID=A0ABM0X0P2_CAMSA|nr:PREDICTED: agamous-like MADS-box protein AGL86 [Camelina sativa]XP_010478906.1 PREDICTED: agamous-like MADS-box protein AGL86 [Camelina sativa]